MNDGTVDVGKIQFRNYYMAFLTVRVRLKSNADDDDFGERSLRIKGDGEIELRAAQWREKKQKQGRIHDNPVADGWAGAVG